MSLDKLTQEGDDPAYVNRFYAGTLPTPTGKIANFLNQRTQEEQMSIAGHLFQLLENCDGDRLFQLNAAGNETRPLTALVMFPDSSKVRLVYGPELGIAQIGAESALDEKLLWLMNEMEDGGASPQPLVLPAEYVICQKTMGRDSNLVKAATKAQLEKPSFAHSDSENVEWEVMRIAPIPAFLALDAISQPVEAADILERLESVDAPVGNPANMIVHLRKFLMTAWVKHNQKKSARLENTDFILGYNSEAASWAKEKSNRMFPTQPPQVAPTAGVDVVLLQQLLLQQQGLVQQLNSPAPAAAAPAKDEKGWSELEVKRILTMCGKQHKATPEDNITELPAIFKEVQKEKNKSLQLQLIKEKLDSTKHYADSPTPNNPELFEVLRKRDFFAQDGASDPSINAAFKHLSLFLCIRLSTEELEVVEEQREILEKTEAKTSADIAKAIKKGVPVIPEAFHDFVDALRMFANTLWAYFGDTCPLFLRVQSLIEAIMGFETSARKMFDYNQKAIILWLTFLEGRAFSKGKGDSVKAFDYMLNQLTWKIGRVTYAQMPVKLIRKEDSEEKKEDDNIRKLPPKATGSPPTSPDKRLRIDKRPTCLKAFDEAINKVKKAQNKKHISISSICKACDIEIADLFEFRACANHALYGICSRRGCTLPHKDLNEAQAKYSLDKLEKFMADPVQLMG